MLQILHPTFGDAGSPATNPPMISGSVGVSDRKVDRKLTSIEDDLKDASPRRTFLRVPHRNDLFGAKFFHAHDND